MKFNLTEGGAGGHLPHLYDDLGLTFGEIKDVLNNASQGKLEKTSEKTDGMNLVFTFNVAEGELKAARSGGDIKRGGMSAGDLASKFFGRGNVEDAFNTAFGVLNDALLSIPEKTKTKIFGPNGNKWYSIEIIYEMSPNTINYDGNHIVFHGMPIYDVKPDGSIEEGMYSPELDLLTSKIEQMQKAVTMKNWVLHGPALVNLKKISDDSISAKAIAEINSAMASGGVGDNNTVYDYLRSLMADEVAELNLPPNIAKMTIERSIEAPGAPGIPEIKKNTPKELQQSVVDFIKSSESLKDKMVKPIEMAIHRFAIEILRGMNSLMIADSREEVARLQAQVAKAVKAIESSGNEAAMAILQREMSKLESIENLAAPIEGLVFVYKGTAYKFTGAFAPAHQLLSLFKYGRKGIPKMDLGEAKQFGLAYVIGEGGKEFETESITLKEYEELYPFILNDLTFIGAKNIEPVGSTGKKSVMGDIDLAAEFDGTRDDFFDKAIAMFGRENISKVGSTIVSIKYPLDERFVQIDVMLGDVGYLTWARAGTSSMKDHRDYSPVKGVIRNILLNTVARFIGQLTLTGEQSDTERTRYSIDFDKGLYKVVQTKRSKKPGKFNKDWRVLDRELVTADKNEIVQIVFGEGYSADDLRKFEDVVEAINSAPKTHHFAKKILTEFLDEVHERAAELPAIVGGDESLLDYIEKVCTGKIIVGESISRGGSAYENVVINALYEAGIQGNIKSGAGDASTTPDADMIINNEVHYLEVKLNDRAQMGGGSIGWKQDVGFFPTGSPAAQNRVQEVVEIMNQERDIFDTNIVTFVDFLNSTGMPAGAKQVNGFPMSGFYVPAWGEASKQGLLKPLNKAIMVDVSFIFAHYAHKNVNYIQIGGHGLFYMQDNPANLPIPRLSGKTVLEIRVSRSGSKGSPFGSNGQFRVQARLNVNGNSPYTFDDPDSIRKMLDVIYAKQSL